MNPRAQSGAPARPIQDVAPPRDTMVGNPTQFASAPTSKNPISDQQALKNNPIAGGSLPTPAKPKSIAPKADDLDLVLKDVNKEVKKSMQIVEQFTKPTFVVAAAVVVGLILMGLAFFAFRRPS